MNDVLKQRLVGALILVALGVVFWPIVFVQPEEESNMDEWKIPPPPAVATTPIQTPDPSGLRQSGELTAVDDPSANDLAAADEGFNEVHSNSESGQGASVETGEAAPAAREESEALNTRSEAPQRLAVDGDGVPVAWTLQVATVSSYDKAEALRKRLLEKSEKAYVTSVSKGGKQLYRVSVGPKFERYELEKIQASIDSEFGVKTMLVRYLP